VPLAHENHHGPTGVACELDSRRANLASAIGSIRDRSPSVADLPADVPEVGHDRAV
jgi:hypothetical protein